MSQFINDIENIINKYDNTIAPEIVNKGLILLQNYKKKLESGIYDESTTQLRNFCQYECYPLDPMSISIKSRKITKNSEKKYVEKIKFDFPEEYIFVDLYITKKKSQLYIDNSLVLKCGNNGEKIKDFINLKNLLKIIDNNNFDLSTYQLLDMILHMFNEKKVIFGVLIDKIRRECNNLDLYQMSSDIDTDSDEEFDDSKTCYYNDEHTILKHNDNDMHVEEC
jgi:hypothetical protein